MKLRIDIRDLPPEKLDATLSFFPASAQYLITAWQWSAWKNRDHSASERMAVMVPDFLHYARLASTGQAKDILRLPGSLGRVMKSAVSCVPTGFSILPGLARGDFWAAAEAMLAYDLGLLDSGFKGDVILHFNLSDFAWTFEKQDFLNAFRRKVNKRARWGIATQQIEPALSACSRWGLAPDSMVYSTGISRPEYAAVEAASAHQFRDTNWILDLTQWPEELLVENELFDFHRDLDNEWLLTISGGIKVCRDHGLIEF